MRRLTDERGVALPLALMCLALLLPLMLAFASLSVSEPLIAGNQVRASQARALAESGLEYALHALSTPTSLGGLPSPLPAAPAAPFDGRTFVALGLTGGFTVQVVNHASGDPQVRTITAIGWSPDYGVAGAWPRILAAPRVLTHCDFQSGNVVWQRSRLSGIVDWEGAVSGPPGYDVGWARLDLVLLYDEHRADVFLDAYNAAADIPVEDPALADLWAVARSHRSVQDWVPNYRDLSRPDLTAGELRRRHTAWTVAVTRRG